MSIIDIDIIDLLYIEYMSDPGTFVYECLRIVHNAVDAKLSVLEDCKKIVYEYDVLSIITIWEQQAKRHRSEFTTVPTYLDFVLVPVLQKLFTILEKKYNCSFVRDSFNNISIENSSIIWNNIYCRNYFN